MTRAGLYRSTPRGSDLTQVTPPGQYLAAVTGSGQSVVVAENDLSKGMALLDRGKLHRFKYRGKDLHGVVPSLSSTGALGYTTVQYSKNGDVLSTAVVVEKRAGVSRPRTVFTLPNNGTAQPFVIGPAWSPDGKTLAFTRTDEMTGRSLLIVMRGTKVVRRVDLHLHQAGPPAWSPNSATVVVASSAKPRASVLVNTTTGRRTNLSSGWYPMCWSPTGRQLLATKGSSLGLITLAAESVNLFEAPSCRIY